MDGIRGQLADGIFLQAPLDPSAYADNGMADQLLAFAVRQIDRNKLRWLVSADAILSDENAFVALPNEQAMSYFGQIDIAGDSEIAPGDLVNFVLAGSADPLEWDNEAVGYKYSFTDAGNRQTVWINNEAAISHRLRLADKYKLGGVALRGLGDREEAAGYTNAITHFWGKDDPPEPQGAIIFWTVYNEDGTIYEQANGELLTYQWTSPQQEGAFSAGAEFMQGDAHADLGRVALVVVDEEVTPEATPVPADETADGSTDADTSDEANDTVPENAGIARVSLPSNVRSGPGLSYPPLAGADPGTEVVLTGRDFSGEWVQIQMPAIEQAGWIYAPLLDMDEGFDLMSLSVAQADAPPTSFAANPTSVPPPTQPPQPTIPSPPTATRPPIWTVANTDGQSAVATISNMVSYQNPMAYSYPMADPNAGSPTTNTTTTSSGWSL